MEPSQVVSDFINNLSSAEPRMWCVCAINRRLTDLALRGTPRAAQHYLRTLGELVDASQLGSSYTPINILNPFKRALFCYYATEHSGVDPNLIHDVPQEELQPSQDLIAGAAEILREHLPGYHAEFSNYVNNFLLYESSTFSSGTTFSLGGAIFIQSFAEINNRNLFIVLDRVIHETAHLHLHYQSMDDPFVLNELDVLYPSPFRDSTRPMIGVFHAHFVLFRLLEAFSNLPLKSRFGPEPVSRTVENYRAAFDRTKKVLSKHGKFTPLGQKIFRETICKQE